MTVQERQMLSLCFFLVGGMDWLYKELKARGVGRAVVWHPTAMQCATLREGVVALRRGGWLWRDFATQKEADHYSWTLRRDHPEGIVSLHYGFEEPRQPEQLSLLPSMPTHEAAE